MENLPLHRDCCPDALPGLFRPGFPPLSAGTSQAGALPPRNHILYHHAIYRGDHLVSEKYIDEEKSNTAFYVIPSLVLALAGYVLLSLDILIVYLVSFAASFSLHVYLHTQNHTARTWLNRFRWFRRKQLLHALHHNHPSKNFAVVEFFWDKVFGTYVGAELRRK